MRECLSELIADRPLVRALVGCGGADAKKGHPAEHSLTRRAFLMSWIAPSSTTSIRETYTESIALEAFCSLKRDLYM